MDAKTKKLNIITAIVVALVLAITALVTAIAVSSVSSYYIVVNKNGGAVSTTRTPTKEEVEALKVPEGVVDVVYDTDGSTDDLFALAYLLASGEKLNCKAVFAAPFTDGKTYLPSSGVQKSYKAINGVLSLCMRYDLTDSVYKGADSFLPDEENAVDSAAADRLIELSAGYGGDKRLFVVCTAALTNVASALLIDPTLAERVTVVWLGGNSFNSENNRENNTYKDVAAARVVFASPVPLVQIQCDGVASGFYMTSEEAERSLSKNSAINKYLCELVRSNAADPYEWSRVLWDVTAIGWVLNEGSRFTEETIALAPTPEYNDKYSFSDNAKFYKYVYKIYRERLLADMFEKLNTYD